MKKYEEPSLELIRIEADVITASTFGAGIIIFDESGNPGSFIDPYNNTDSYE